MAVSLADSYTITVPSGLSLLANHLDTGGNTLQEVLPLVTNGTQILKYNCNGTYTTNTMVAGAWSPAGTTLNPGEGAFIDNNSGAPFNLTFTGAPHVPVLPPSLPCGCGVDNLVSCQTTNSPSTFEDIMGFPPTSGARLFRFDGSGFIQYTRMGANWSPSNPVVNLGESVFVRIPACATAPVLNCVSNKTVDGCLAWSFDPPTNITVGCYSNYSLTFDTVTNSGPCPLVTTRTWLIKDICGNTNTCSQTVTASCCSNPCTPVSMISLNTGYDQTANTTYAVGAADAFWTVISDPDGTTTEPRPAKVIAKHGAWKPAQAGSQWISSYPTAIGETNGTYVFETYFCVASNATNLALSVCLRADDAAAVFLNGNLIPLTPPNTAFGTATPACGTANIQSWFVLGGQNTLRVQVTNIGAVAMGLNLAATVTGSNLALDPAICCRPLSGISGQKFYDLNGNGVRNNGEPALAGWTINLSGGGSTVTDSKGYYYFQNLPTGSYTVTETPQAGWTQTAPAGGAHIVTLGTAQQVNLRDFGNTRSNILGCIQINCPSNIVTTCTDGGAVVPFSVTATNLCSNNVPIVFCSLPSGNWFEVGTTTVDCTAYDPITGNYATCSFTVTVVDNTPPVIQGATNLVVIACTNVAVSYNPTASDSCCDTNLGSITVTCTPPSGTLFATGTTNTIQCVAVDCNGNTNTTLFTVTVICPCPPDPVVLFNTGVGPNSVVLTNGAVDPHYALTTNPHNGGTNAIVVAGNGLANTATSKWIGPVAGTSSNGTYVYTMTFYLPCTNDAVITGQWAVDNSGTIDLNGIILVDTIATTDQSSFTTWHPFTITTGLVAGQNTLNFAVTNDGAGDTALRVELSGSANCCCSNQSTVSLNTGYAQNTSTTYATGVADAFWRVTADPTVPGATLPRPATVIQGNPAWQPAQANSKWISSYPTDVNDLNGVYVFETDFCLEPGATNMVLNVCLRADDAASVSINGHPITLSSPNTRYNAPSPACGTANNPAWFVPGVNTLRVSVTNSGAAAMGLNLSGSVTGSGLIDPTSDCCRPASGISGQKFYDLNGNGVRDSGEPPLSNWTINLAGGASTVTDVNGFYYFQNLPAGGFTVTETLKPGWMQTAPVGGAYNVTLASAQQVNQRDFGNWKTNLSTNCVFITCPSNIVTACTGMGAVVPFTVTATNLCSSNAPGIFCSLPSNHWFPVGTTTVNCTATDPETGDYDTCSFTVTVVDTTPPVIHGATNLVVTSCTNIAVAYNPTASDSCCDTNLGGITVICSPPSGTLFAPGTTNTVQCVAVDCNGITNTTSFTVTVTPPLPPLSWTPRLPMVAGRSSSAAALLPSGRVLVAGGSTAIASFSTAAEVFDPTLNGWLSGIPALPQAHRFTAVRLLDGKVLVAGDDPSTTFTAYLYDEVNSPTAWLPAGNPNSQHIAATLTRMNSGNVLLAGGYCGGACVTYKTAEIYAPGPNGWTTTGSMTNTRHFHTATLLPSGKVLVAGGAQRDPIVVRSECELFDEGLGTWSPAATMNQLRAAHTATLLPNGKVLVVGGSTGPNDFGQITATTEIYDPTLNTWAPVASMSTPRFLHTATLLDCGKLLITGGQNDSGTVSSCELYDYENNSWSTTTPMSVARTRHTATLLLSGQVFVTGGLGIAGGYLASSEIYTPACCCGSTNKTVACGTAWSFDVPSAANLCDGYNPNPVVLSTLTNGLCPQVITRTWLFTNDCGFSNTCSQTVTVLDTTPPLITCASNKIVVAGPAWNFDAPGVTDECSGTNVTLTYTTVTNGVCPQLFTRTWIATDLCGNTNTCGQIVTVQCVPNLIITWPSNGTTLTLTWPTNIGAPYWWLQSATNLTTGSYWETYYWATNPPIFWPMTNRERYFRLVHTNE